MFCEFIKKVIFENRMRGSVHRTVSAYPVYHLTTVRWPSKCIDETPCKKYTDCINFDIKCF